MGHFDARVSAFAEWTLGYHPYVMKFLTLIHNLDSGHCQAGSLTGAVASESGSEALKGSLRPVGNRPKSAKA